MTISRLVAVGCISIVLLSSGCDETMAKNNSEVNVEDANKKVPTKEVPTKEVQIRGMFKKSFEVYELEANDILYYVFDPKQLLIKQSRRVNQEGYYKHFDACVIGDISSKGKFGPLGRYQQQITVHGICEWI